MVVMWIKSVNMYKALRLVPVSSDRERKHERKEGRKGGKKCPTKDPLC